MGPKFSWDGRAYGLPKIQKDYKYLPSFYPIIDKTNTLSCHRKVFIVYFNKAYLKLLRSQYIPEQTVLVFSILI